MVEERLADLAILAIENETVVSLDFDHILDQFSASDKNRQIALNWLTALNTMYYYYNQSNI